MAPAGRRAPHTRRRGKPLNASRAATVVIDLTMDNLNQRREAVLEELKTATDVVDLTNLEDLAVRLVSFTLESGHNIRKTRCYTLGMDGWKDVDDGSVLGGFDVHSVTEAVLRPVIGYPVRFLLRPDGRGSLTGARTYKHYKKDRKNGDDGYDDDDGLRMSLGLGEVEAMIEEPWTEGGFIACVGTAE